MDGRDGKRVMRDARALLLAWDALGVAGEPEAADEYDCMIGPLVGQLRGGADDEHLVAWLARERASHFGLDADARRDRALADALLAWWRRRGDREEGAAAGASTTGAPRAASGGAHPDGAAPDGARA